MGRLTAINIKKSKIISKLFYAIIGWPQIDIAHDEAVEAIERFMFIGKLLLIHQPHPDEDRPVPPTKGFTYLSITIDLFILTIIIELLCAICTDDLITLAYLGDIFVGMNNEYALRMLCLCGAFCLGAFRAVSCYLARNGSLDWAKVIDRAMIYGWKPEVLNMKQEDCLKWRQISVFMSRQIVGTSVVSALVWLTCLTYSTYNCETFYLALKRPLILTCFLFRQIITLFSIIVVVPQVAWFSFLFIISVAYLIYRSNSVYIDLQKSLQFESLPVSVITKLCTKNISLLNEFEFINRGMSYVSYCGYTFVSVAGQVAMLYSYLGLFGMPLADLGLGIIGFNTVFQIGVISFLAAKSVSKIGLSYSHYHRIYQNNYNIEPRLKLKLLYNLDRLSSPYVGFWIGESFLMDNYSFITYLLETCSNMMLIIVTMPALIWKDQ
uniref:Gustatory receptor n=1 Tax=Tetranychus urticae TaxID=32264 RepID=T1K0T2_TETUR